MPPRIDHDKCDLCGRCVFQCGRYVFAFHSDKERVTMKNAKQCIDCYVCMLVCPRQAVSIVRTARRTG